MARDFESWEKVINYLTSDDCNGVYIRCWRFWRGGMKCDAEEECCSDTYRSTAELLEDLKLYSQNDITEVQKD